MKTKILVLGATGMLGNAVLTELSKNECFEVSGAARNTDLLYNFVKTNNLEIEIVPEIDVLDQSNWLFNTLNDDYSVLKYDYVINCVGVIKPFMAKSTIDAIKINSLFPIQLAKLCLNKCNMIHVSTDCVYSGLAGSYRECDPHDCTDDYGKSKSLGEPLSDCMVIRTSVVGKEIHKNASLLSWAMSKRGEKVDGFTNHLWNGVTTNEYGKILTKIIKNNLYKRGSFNVFGTSVTKYEMLKKFNEKFDLQLNIIPTETKTVCDRTLSTIHCLNEKLNIPSFNQMVDEW